METRARPQLLTSITVRAFDGWEFEGNFGYYQSVQTLLAIYQTSNLSYGGSMRHVFPKKIVWSVGVGGGRSGFEQVSGDGNHSESVTSSLSVFRYSLGATYSKSDGASVVTANGFVPLPIPLVSNNVVMFNGIGKGLTFSGAPVRRMSFNASYSELSSDFTGLITNGAPTFTKTEQISSYLTYTFRKLYFNAGVLHFQQSIGSPGVPPSVVTSYYFGLSRWFKAF